MEIKIVQPLHVIEEKIYMNNIRKVFEKGTAFIPFITCGDPSLDVTKEAVIEMEKAGADLIELGIPFSDPTAEGPLIQEANLRALQNQITTDDIFQMVRELRETVKIPMVFMAYANVVFSYGVERFVATCKEIGIGGLILPEIPFEEKREFDEICKKYDVDLISIIAPTSKERIGMIAKEAEGFVYCVSSAGEKENALFSHIGSMIKKVKKERNIPCAVGIESSSLDHIKELAKKVDGIIAGTTIVKLCEKYGIHAPFHIGNYVKEVKMILTE